MFRTLSIFLLAALSAMAADVAGTWKAKGEGPNGPMERTFVFKVDGNKLTGETTSSIMGKSQIQDGKIEGDALSFMIQIKFQDNEMQVQYKGKVTGNDMKLTADVGGQTLEWQAKKVE